MEMEREINFLSDDELDAVVGGKMNNGQINQLVLKNPQDGVPGSTGGHDGGLWGVLGFLGGALVVAAAFTFHGNQT
jgi:hypothetical protein